MNIKSFLLASQPYKTIFILDDWAVNWSEPASDM